MLMAMATIFGNVMTLSEQVPERIAAAILAFTSNKIAILLMINVLLLWVRHLHGSPLPQSSSSRQFCCLWR